MSLLSFQTKFIRFSFVTKYCESFLDSFIYHLIIKYKYMNSRLVGVVISLLLVYSKLQVDINMSPRVAEDSVQERLVGPEIELSTTPILLSVL